MFKRMIASVGAAGLAATVLVSTGSVAGASHIVDPEVVPKNPTCADLGYDNQVKIEASNLTDSYDDGSFSVELAFDVASGTLSFADASPGVLAVIMKGGAQGAHVYDYGLPTTADSDLVTPLNPSGKNAAISHVTFCVGEPRPTS